MKFHPDVLAAHAEFGGDLEDMQRNYDAPPEDHISSLPEGTADAVSVPSTGWQDIASAPTDGTLVLVYCPAHPHWPIRSVRWDDEYGRAAWYYVYDECLSAPPTHWMPLPSPPTQTD